MENEIKILSSVNCICLIWIVCLYYCFIFRVSIVVASIIIVVIIINTLAGCCAEHSAVVDVDDDILSSLLYCLYLPGEKFHIEYIIFKGKLGKINSIKIIMYYIYDSVSVALLLLYPCVNNKRVLLWWQQKVFNWMSSLRGESKCLALNHFVPSHSSLNAQHKASTLRELRFHQFDWAVCESDGKRRIRQLVDKRMHH